jgi:hypothetical protein
MDERRKINLRAMKEEEGNG